MRLGGTLLCVCALALAGCAGNPNLPPAGAAGWHGAAPNSDQTFRFVILADRTGGHIPGEFEKAVAEVNLLKPDFVMCVGDLVEGYTTDQTTARDQWQEFEKIVSKLDAPFYYCPGNHDVLQESPTDPPIMRRMYLQRHAVSGKSYYSFDFKGSHFLVLDTPSAQQDPAFAQEQVEFIRHDLVKAKDAQNIFIFTHYPIYDSKALWPQISPLLPRERTTVFDGHWHRLVYKLADGIPVYVLPSTAAVQDPSEDRLYTHVAVNSGKPAISFISPGQVKPAAYAQATTDLRETLKTAGVSGIPVEGGELFATPSNPSAEMIQVHYQWLAADWDITPSETWVNVGPGRTEKIRFIAKPLTATPTNPTIITRGTAGGFSTSLQAKAPISRTGELGTIGAITLDGQPGKWNNVAGIEMAQAPYLFENRDAWKGPQDSSCVARFALTPTDLAIFVEVKDDQLNIDQPDPWTNDAIELCWDVRPDAQRGPTMTAGTGQITIVPAADFGPPKALSWSPAGKYGLTAPAGIKTFTRKTPQGYNIEALIPLSQLGLDGGTAKSRAIRLALCLDDRDIVEGKPVLKRMSLTGTGDFWRSPAGYARFTLKP